MSSEEYIGFPRGVLGDEPIRLRVLYREGGVIAIDKPKGVVVDADDRLGLYPAIIPGIRQQLERGKPELEALGVEAPFAVYPLEQAVTGVVVFGTNREGAEGLRNLYGSNLMGFTFRVWLKEKGGLEGELGCDLPVFWDESRNRAVVSHRSGKKAETLFVRIERVGEYSLWEARTSYLRPGQVCLHASELGLSVLGDRLYGRVPMPKLSWLKRGYSQKRGVDERPIYEGLAMHLSSVRWEHEGEVVLIESAEPKGFKVLEKHFKKYAS